MFNSRIDLILTEFSSAACLRDIGVFWSFRSTVPGLGLRQASEFLVRRHAENGLQAELHAYPADDHTKTLDGRKNPLAWTPRSASLSVAEPSAEAGLICSYASEPLCLISNSTATPPEGLTCEVVVLHSGTKPEDYEGLDAAGKIVFTDVWPLLADEQARLHGAAGLVTDSVTPPWLYSYPPVRQPADVPDLTMWGVLNGRSNRQPLWGFSLSPRQGQRLRRLIRDSAVPVRLHAQVDAVLSEGVSEVVSTLLPAMVPTTEEIWVLSHSSEPGALDDASGCCMTLEIARTLNALIKQGLLTPPRRAIRFLNAVETEGYLPFIAEKMSALSQVKAALALDSVGSDCRQSGANLHIFRSPDYNPSFADALLEQILSEVVALPNERFCSDPYDLFPWRVDPCFPGNDNFLADGFFDIPTPMLCDWPDKFYHSNQDTADKLSLNSLGRCGLIAALYLYSLASAGPEDTSTLAGLTLRSYKHRLLEKPDPQVFYQGLDALRSLLRFQPDAAEAVSACTGELEAFAVREIPAFAGAVPLASPGWEGDNPILRPLLWQFPAREQFTPQALQRLDELRGLSQEVDRVWAYLNGRRSAQEIQLRLEIAPQVLLDTLAFFIDEGLADRETR